MNKILKTSLFTMGIVLNSGAMAATGTGHAQAELTQPLTVTNTQDVSFGTIAIDPSAGPQTIEIDVYGDIVSCPGTYVCSGPTYQGKFTTSGAPNTSVSFSTEGVTAILDNGLGDKLIFDPYFGNRVDSAGTTLGSGGAVQTWFGGTIQFTGNEPAGIYSSNNTGGSGYTVTVNY